MAATSEEQSKKHICVGILAHVDAGKTTLSEGLLYTAGKLRSLGRVDKGDAYLDTYAMEKERGITIFSKQAVFEWEDTQVTLLDTPGHMDFSAEMERTLQVLDYAILVISGPDGVQGHTQTLWRLLRRYGIPVFLFVNKMDQPGTERDVILRELKERLDDGITDFSGTDSDDFMEQVALCDEKLLEQYLEEGQI
ncbi:MAG: GTP-binding protein, partial [Eubacterium sp.]|nr:GTP-binding protein [Eubacterium sp.]